MPHPKCTCSLNAQEAGQALHRKSAAAPVCGGNAPPRVTTCDVTARCYAAYIERVTGDIAQKLVQLTYTGLLCYR